MLRSFARLAPSLAALALVLGSAAPALADLAPRREHKKSTLEPHKPPPMEEPAEPSEVEAPPEPEPETEAEPEPKAEPEAKTETKPEAEPEPEAKAETKSGSCSITDDPERGLIGLAALVLVISGAGLRRRRP